MIPFNLKIGKQKQAFDIPTSWNQISYFQAVALSEMEDFRNPIDLVHILTGIDQDTLKSMESGAFDKILTPCYNLFTDKQPDFLNLSRTKEIRIRGKEYSTELNPAKVTANAMWTIQAEFEGKDNEYVSKNLHRIIAHGLSGQVITDKDGKPRIDEAEVELLAIEIGNMPAFDVYPVGIFFLKRLSSRLTQQLVTLAGELQAKRKQRKLNEFRLSGLSSRWRRFAAMIGRKQNSTFQQSSV